MRGLHGDIERFIVMRAHRFGSIRRLDVEEAFRGYLCRAKAAASLTKALDNRENGLVRKKGSLVVPALGAKTPEMASGKRLVESMLAGEITFKSTGLRASELTVSKVAWDDESAVDEAVFSALLSAVLKQRLVRIKYVGLRRYDRGSERLISPVEFETLGGKLRIVAHDIDDKDKQKTFIVGRILHAELSEEKSPARLQTKSLTAKEPFSVTLNPYFTKEQARVFANELGVNAGRVMMSPRHCFEYLRRNSDIPVSEDAVWPLVVSVEPI